MAEGEPLSQQPKKTPKVWNIKDNEFVFAPPKPDGDPWDVLLKPLMEKDKIRCVAWKEEVQNLLIFAGLFSAVVTAFVIESYKTLQPDPNIAIVSLLSHIATRLDNSVNGTLESIIITNPVSFSPTSSSIRVNIFWFLSLILSLTTVLVGIVALQWLREYQTYPGLSPKESLAIFRMRAEGMEKWYVWKIFTALPLLLQAALVLFFGGVIDFLLMLDHKVAIPITATIGLTLLFLVATTVFPTFQGIFLHLPFLFVRDLSKEPSQCPYKSPQSQAFRAILSLNFTLLHHICPTLRHICQAIIFSSLFLLRYLITVVSGKAPRGEPHQTWRQRMEDHHVLPHLSVTWKKQTWVEFDSAWLLLRDACVHGMKDNQPGLTRHRKKISAILPLFDSVQAIRETVADSHIDTFRISPIYHTFSELSRSVVGFEPDGKPPFFVKMGGIHRRNRYFRSIWGERFRRYEPEYDFIQYGRYLSTQDSSLLHCQNMSLFTSNNWIWILSSHVTELQIRLSGYYWSTRRSKLSAWDPELPTPQLSFPNESEFEGNKVLSWQFSRVLMSFFKSAAKEDLDISQGSLYGHPGVVDFLEDASKITYLAIISRDDVSGGPVTEEGIDLPDAYLDILAYISEHLNQSLSKLPVHSDDTVRPEMSYFFYVSAIYVKGLIMSVTNYDSKTNLSEGGVVPVRTSLRNYKRQTGGPNRLLEDQFKGEGRDPALHETVNRFTKKWWSFLDYIHTFV